MNDEKRKAPDEILYTQFQLICDDSLDLYIFSYRRVTMRKFNLATLILAIVFYLPFDTFIKLCSIFVFLC